MKAGLVTSCNLFCTSDNDLKSLGCETSFIAVAIPTGATAIADSTVSTTKFLYTNLSDYDDAWNIQHSKLN